MTQKPSIYARCIVGGLVASVLLATAWGLNESLGEKTPELPEFPELVDADETQSIKNRLFHWLVDQTVTGERERRFLSGPPATDPACVIREVSSDGTPIVDHSKGW